MWQALIAAPILVVVLAIILPILLLGYVGRLIRGLWLKARLSSTWPQGRIGLVAYTANQKWAPYLEQELLPKIAASCVVVNRSDAQWKERFPLEAKAIAHWGGLRAYNPIAILLTPTDRVRVFRLYDAFQQRVRGKPKRLEEVTRELVATVELYSRNDRSGR